MKRVVGNINGMGSSVNKALYNDIVKPIMIPTTVPIIQLEKTKTKASYTKRRIILFLLTPTALRIAISFVYSIRFAVIELTKLKKQSTIVIAVKTVKMTSIKA